MSIKTLVINPGSTSTKVAIYQDDKAVRELTLRHSTEELAPFAGVLDQFDFRKQIILDAMKEAGVNIVGLGYTIYLGSEYESTMLAEAGELSGVNVSIQREDVFNFMYRL